MTYSEIAQKVGVSKQRISQVLGKQDVRYFVKIDEDACLFPNLAAWMNENKVSRMEFVRRMGYEAIPPAAVRFSDIMKGRLHPRKPYIDRMMKVTGMTYEKLFAVNENDC